MGVIKFDDARHKSMWRWTKAKDSRDQMAPEANRFERGWCKKIDCCIATVQAKCSRTNSHLLNSLFQIALSPLQRVGMPLAGKRGVHDAGKQRIRAHKIGSSVSLAGAMSLLASFKPGRNGRRSAREKQDFSASDAIEQQASSTNTQLSSPEDDQADTGKSHWRWLDRAIVALWIAMLLSIIAYALIGGEVVMAQLDGLDLVAAYSLWP